MQPFLSAYRLSIAGLVLLSAAGFLFRGPPLTAPGIDYSVHAEGLEQVAALAGGADGTLYATLEKGHGRGELVRLAPGGRQVLLSGLDKPDGLTLVDGTLFVTNETGDVGLLAFSPWTGVRRYTGVTGAEGLDAGADGGLLVVEDLERNARLLHVDPDSGAIDVLRAGLSNAEGVCEAPDGSIYVAEKHAPYLSRLTPGGLQHIGEGLVKPAFLRCLPDGTVLVTEDRTHFGRLLRFGADGMEVLVRHLRAPQAVVVGADGALYLAEQNRDRVLRFDGV